jgi:hypothetical protein
MQLPIGGPRSGANPQTSVSLLPEADGKPMTSSAQSNMDEDSKWTVSQLRSALHQQGQRRTGSKSELRRRWEEFKASEDTQADGKPIISSAKSKKRKGSEDTQADGKPMTSSAKSNMDEEWTVIKFRSMLQKHGQPITGRKSELLRRWEEF